MRRDPNIAIPRRVFPTLCGVADDDKTARGCECLLTKMQMSWDQLHFQAEAEKVKALPADSKMGINSPFDWAIADRIPS